MAGGLMAVSLRRLLRAPPTIVCRKAAQNLFGRYLLATNIGFSATFSWAGDFIVQQYEMSQGRKDKFDVVRSFQVTVSGGMVGIFCHYWYIFLDSRFPGRSIRTVLTKVAVDQAICSPIYLFGFLGMTCILENKNWEESRQELSQKGWRLLLADYAVWPPAQIINFYLLPLRYRVLFDNAVSLAFDIYTSYVKYEIPLVDD